MPTYAKLNEQNIVIIEATTDHDPDGLDKDEWVESSGGMLGKVYNHDTKTFSDQPDANTYLHIAYPELAKVGEEIQLNVSVKFANNVLVPIDTSYYVPIVRQSDGGQITFLTIKFTQGETTASFIATEPGIYIMKPESIRPKPSSKVVKWPEIVVIEA